MLTEIGTYTFNERTYYEFTNDTLFILHWCSDTAPQPINTCSFSFNNRDTETINRVPLDIKNNSIVTLMIYLSYGDTITNLPNTSETAKITDKACTKKNTGHFIQYTPLEDPSFGDFKSSSLKNSDFARFTIRGGGHTRSIEQKKTHIITIGAY